MSLSFLERMVEERILDALRRGEFDNLPGRGEPLPLNDDRAVPEDLRLACKILRNANCLPPELEMRREIVRLRELLAAVDDSDERKTLARQLNGKIMRLNLSRCSSPLIDIPQVPERGVADSPEGAGI